MKIVSELGQGGFGIVYLVEDSTQKQYALKEIKSSHNLQRELEISKAMKNVICPEITRIYDVFTEGDKYFILMEYCKNGSLEDFMKSSRGKEIIHKEEVCVNFF
jgi:serine/threonine protein kinase